MDWTVHGAVVLLLWVLVGQYTYREAVRENRSSPALRGLLWGVLGVTGVLSSLARGQALDPRRLGWLGVAALCCVPGSIGLSGFGGVRTGFYGVAGVIAGLFVLYWQFELETGVGEDSATDEPS